MAPAPPRLSSSAAPARDPAGPRLQPIVDDLGRRRDELAHETLRRLQTEDPVYARIEDELMLADIVDHVAENHDALRASLLRGAPVRSKQLSFIRPHAAMRAERGVPLASFLHAFRIGHRVIWDAILDSSHRHPASSDAALAAVGPVMDYIDRATTEAAETYLEAQQLLLAEGERFRRDLLEDLLAGRDPAPGPVRSAAAAAGLDPDTSCIALVAAIAATPHDTTDLRSAATVLTNASGGAVRPLTVVRQDEIVLVRAITATELTQFTERVRTAHRTLTAAGVHLMIGISALQDTIRDLPQAYKEAHTAIGRLGGTPGVFPLNNLTVLDYLLLQSDKTAGRLIPKQLAEFVRDDLAAGGTLTKTLIAYADANLNAKEAAQQMFVHVNTVHYRLDRIAERTGRELRRLDDVLDLLIAVRLIAGSPPPETTGTTTFARSTPHADDL